jgi:cell division protein ZapE
MDSGSVMNVREFYENALDQRGYKADEAQMRAINRLQLAYEEWTSVSSRSAISKLFSRSKTPPQGVYMWGGVGRGKSFLMDSFYSVVPIERKTRLHFHEFMRDVHRQLDQLKGIANPLDEVATRIAKKYQLICFDEFHVSDIADAMILYNLLKGLFDRGVSFVMTSNYEPSTLYPDGLHRDRMLPTIALLKEKLDVMNIDAGIDYRKRALEQVDAYHTPLGPKASEELTQAFNSVADTADEAPVVEIEARQLTVIRRAGSAIWFDFDTLCAGPRSQNDYLEIASRFQTVILSDIPKMSAAMSSPARRFTWLIDVFYDHKVKLIMSAEVEPELLYTEGTLSNEFHRTVSRIIEMQSREYMDADRRTGTDSLS